MRRWLILGMLVLGSGSGRGAGEVFVDVDDRRALLANGFVYLLLNRSSAGVEVLEFDPAGQTGAPVHGGAVTTKAVVFSTFDFDSGDASSRTSGIPEVEVEYQTPQEVRLRATGIAPREGVTERWELRLRAGEPGFTFKRTTEWGPRRPEVQRHGIVIHAPHDFDTFYLSNRAAGMVDLWRATPAEELAWADAVDRRSGESVRVWVEGGLHAHSTPQDITGTNTPASYQRDAWGYDFTYHFFLPNGTYQVELAFAEVYARRAGERLMNLFANGQPVAKDWDLLREAGGRYRAVTLRFPATVDEGRLALRFEAVRQAAKVNVIRVWNDDHDVFLACGREWRAYQSRLKLGDLRDNPERTIFLARGGSLPGIALELDQRSRWATFWEHSPKAVRISGEASPAQLAAETTQTAFVRGFTTDVPDAAREAIAADVLVPDLPLGEYLRNQQLKDSMATLRTVQGVTDRQYTSVNPYYESYWIRNAFGQIVGAYPFASAEMRQVFRDQIDLCIRHQREDGLIPETIDVHDGQPRYTSVTRYRDSVMLDPPMFWVWGVWTAYAVDRDREWLAARIENVERTVAYLRRQDRDGNGLMEMDVAGDWADHVEREGECAYVNAFLYQTLRQAADLEEALGRAAPAQEYRTAADGLQRHYNRPVADGGLWDEGLRYLRGCRKEGWDYLEIDSLFAACAGVVDAARARQMLATYRSQEAVDDPVPGKLSYPTYKWSDSTWSGYEHRWTWLAVVEGMALNRLGQTDEAYRLYERLAPLGAGRSYLREFYRDDGSPGGQYDIWYYGFNALLARDLLGLAYSPAGLRFEPHFPASWVNARGPAEARLNGKSYAAAIKGFRYGKTLLDLYYDRPTAASHQVRGLSVNGAAIAGPALPEATRTGERVPVIVHF